MNTRAGKATIHSMRKKHVKYSNAGRINSIMAEAGRRKIVKARRWG
jgi:hypothetical protein